MLSRFPFRHIGTAQYPCTSQLLLLQCVTQFTLARELHLNYNTLQKGPNLDNIPEILNFNLIITNTLLIRYAPIKYMYYFVSLDYNYAHFQCFSELACLQ